MVTDDTLVVTCRCVAYCACAICKCRKMTQFNENSHCDNIAFYGIVLLCFRLCLIMFRSFCVLFIVPFSSLAHRQQEEYLRRTLDYSEDSTQPASANLNVSDGPTSPLVIDNTINLMESDAKHRKEGSGIVEETFAKGEYTHSVLFAKLINSPVVGTKISTEIKSFQIVLCIC